MKKRMLSSLLVLLLALSSLSACKLLPGVGGSAKKGDTPYYEKFSLALQNTVAKTEGKAFAPGKANRVRAQLTLDKLNLPDEAGLPDGLLPLSLSVEAHGDEENARVGVELEVSGQTLGAEMYMANAKKQILLAAPGILTKNILLDLAEDIPGLPEGGIPSIQPAQIKALGDALKPYVKIIEDAVPKEAKSTEKVDFPGVEGSESVSAKVVRLEGIEIAETIITVLEKVREDGVLREALAPFFAIVRKDIEYFYDDIDDIIEDFGDFDEEDMDGSVFVWERPMQGKRVLGDFIRLEDEGETILDLRMGFSEKKAEAKGFLTLKFADELSLKLELTKTADTAKLSLNINNELKIKLSGVTTERDGVTETETTLAITANGVTMEPLTMTTRVKTMREDRFDVEVVFQLSLPEEFTGIPISARATLTLSGEQAESGVEFPADYEGSLYDLEDQDDLMEMQNEFMNAVMAIFQPADFH